jgi:molecular chaperone HtpG
MEKTTEHFQTEVNEILHLIIHSLYSHPEIFLRELVSNASDALDKLKIEALTNAALMPQGYEPVIRLIPNAEKKTLTITDNGVGMTAEEIRENLGKIAHSGTKQFKLAQEKNADLIGQFGVGFYSAFIVADKVTVETQRAGSSEGVRWESDGKGSYTLEPFIRSEGSGTSITLHLKATDGEEGSLQDYTDEWVLRSTIKKHSDFIAYPIKMEVTKSEQSSVEPSESVIIAEDVLLNSQKALWTRTPSDVTKDEYKEFYQHLTRDTSDPLKTIHYKAEGTIEFHALLYVPSTRPWNFDYEGTERGLSLYVKRVLIMNDCEDLLPPYLRFVKGVVDSSDLSLNVSREILQQDRQIAQIRKALTNKVLKVLADMLKEDRKEYEKFWDNFGATLKEGMIREFDKKDVLLPTFLFHSSTESEKTTVAEYVVRMKPGQKDIYYLCGSSLEVLKASPLLERLKQKGFEALLLDHPVDEFITPRLDAYQEHKFVSVADPDLELDTEEEKKEREEKLKEKKEELTPLLEVVKSALKEHVKDVQISSRLTDSAVCLVNDGANPQFMEQLYRQMGKEVPKMKRVMEINPNHPIFSRMQKLPVAQQQDWSEILYGQALLSEGSPLEDPAAFVRKMTQVMVDGSAT